MGIPRAFFFLVSSSCFLCSWPIAAAEPDVDGSLPSLSHAQALCILDRLVAEDEPLCLSYATYVAVAYGCAKTHEASSAALYAGCVAKYRDNFSFLPQDGDASRRLMALVQQHATDEDGALALGVAPARLVNCAVACQGAIESELRHLFFRGEAYRRDMERDCSLETLAPGLAAASAKDGADRS